MSWILPAILVCAVFVAGTLGDKAFGFPKSRYLRASTLERGVDIGASSKVTRKDDNTCTPEEDEDRRAALWCKEEYMRAVREEIQRNNCTNIAFSPDAYDYGDPDRPCVIIDERDDINVSCSVECSYRQFYYLYCKYVGEESVSIDRECGRNVFGADYCSFNSRDFCYIIDSSSLFQTVYDTCLLNNIVSCSDECKETLKNFKDTLGCCVRYHLEYYYEYYDIAEDMLLPSDVFSTCEVKIPDVCNSFSPPKKFLDCAHGGNLHVSPTIFYSITLIMLSLFNAM